MILSEGCGSLEETQDILAVCVEGSLGQGPVLHYYIYIFPRVTIGKHSNEYPEIGVSISSRYVMEPASVIRGDSCTMEVPDQTVDIIEAPRFL